MVSFLKDGHIYEQTQFYFPVTYKSVEGLRHLAVKQINCGLMVGVQR